MNILILISVKSINKIKTHFVGKCVLEIKNLEVYDLNKSFEIGGSNKLIYLFVAESMTNLGN